MSVSGDVGALVYYTLRILDSHCKSLGCCRLLSFMLLLTIDNDVRFLAAFLGFVLAPLAPSTAYKTSAAREGFTKTGSFTRVVQGHSEEHSSLLTAGGGNCAIHAALGVCNEAGVISTPNPRTWVANLLQHCVDPPVTVERLSVHLGAVRAHQTVQNILLAGHCHPLLEEAISANPTLEALCLRERLVVDGEAALLTECAEARQLNHAAAEGRQQRKAELQARLRSLFRLELKESLFRSIALRRQCLPGEFDAPPFYQTAT